MGAVLIHKVTPTTAANAITNAPAHKHVRMDNASVAQEEWSSVVVPVSTQRATTTTAAAAETHVLVARPAKVERVPAHNKRGYKSVVVFVSTSTTTFNTV
tara:strand:- start:19834 stop:20133 length:300 start_codon:yes stop_codon:yes gene_type:complete